MLDLFKGGTEENFGVIERELRCGVWSWNLRTNEMHWSRGYYDLLGLDPAKVTPSFAAILQVTHPDDRRAQAEVERVIQKASTVRRKFRVIRRGGNIAWIYCQIIIFVDPEGAAEKAIGVCADVTAREDQLNQLRISDERYRALIKAAGAVVWIAKSDGRIHELMNCNQAGQIMTSEAGWLQFIHPDYQDKMLRVCATASREKRGYDVVHRFLQSDGTFRWKRSTGQPVLDDGGNIKEWLGISVDLDRNSTRPGAHRITGAQIRAARGLLRWSVMDLAHAAGISRATIRRLEELDGAPSHDDPALPSIEAALAGAGVEFMFPEAGKPGVRPR